MKTITFTASATYPKESVIEFATANGYKQNEEKTAEEFTQEFIKDKLVDMLLAPTLDQINNKFDSAKMEKIAETTDEINTLITVDYD